MEELIEKYNLLIIGLLLLTILILMVYITSQKNKRLKLRDEYAKLHLQKTKIVANELKFQLQPHTLNGILANLKAYSNKLNRGLDSISETLNYIIYEGQSHFVSVEQEIGFIKTYIELNELFVKNRDSISINIDKLDTSSQYFKAYCLPHLISAYFIENAFKHGDKDHPEFLTINLTLTQTYFELVVINKIKPITDKPRGGVGLENMKNRLQTLLTNKFTLESKVKNNEYFSYLIIIF